MAFDQIAAGEPSETYARINRAITYLNSLEAIITTLQSDAATNAFKIAEEAAFRYSVDESIQRGLLQDVAELENSIGEVAKLAIALLSSQYGGVFPGLHPIAYAAATVGLIGSSYPLADWMTISTPFGKAAKIDGVGFIAPRAAVLSDPYSFYVLRAKYWRITDVLDPNNNAVEIGIQWLTSTGGDAGKLVIHQDRNLVVRDGPKAITARVPSIEGDLREIVIPGSAIYWRPYVRTYGTDGATAVGILSVKDVTFAGTYAPDVSDLADRLGSIEGQIASGVPFSTPVLPEYLIVNLPQPPRRGRKAWATDGRAPDAAGVLEPPNAGTGVEVTGNGKAWVITGTNQAVQS